MPQSLVLTSKGVTVIELVTTLAVMAILGAISVPAGVELYSSYERAGARQLIQSDIIRASSRAALLSTRVVFAIQTGGTSYLIGPDYVPLASPPSPETVELTGELPRAMTITPTQNLIFDSRGFLVDTNGNLTEAHLVLSQDGSAFSNITVTPTAGVSFD